MADTLDVLTLAEGRAAIGQDPSTVDSALDAQLELYITGTSRWIDSTCGPMVSRQIVQCAANTSSNTLELTGATEQELDGLKFSDLVSIGTAASPFAVAAGRRVLDVDLDNLTVRIDGPAITTTASHSVRKGRYVDTDSVDSVVKLGATAHLRWVWAVERGASSRNFDDLSAVGETIAVPRRVIDLLGDFYTPGVA